MAAPAADSSADDHVLESLDTQISAASGPPARLYQHDEMVRDLPPTIAVDTAEVETDLPVQQEIDEPVLDEKQYTIQTSPEEDLTIVHDLLRPTAFSIET